MITVLIFSAIVLLVGFVIGLATGLRCGHDTAYEEGWNDAHGDHPPVLYQDQSTHTWQGRDAAASSPTDH